MVDIRPQDLSPAVTPIDADSPVIIDQGLAGVNRTTSTEMVNAVAPVVSQVEAEVGTDDVKRMTALKTKQSIASEIGVSLASFGQGDKADSAVQPLDPSLVPTGGLTGQVLVKATNTAFDTEWKSIASATAVSYGPQTLTEAQKVQARTNIGSATAAQGALADSAVQTVNGISPDEGDINVTSILDLNIDKYGPGQNFISNATYNGAAPDIGLVNIFGGNAANPNLVGYKIFESSIPGNGTSNVFVSDFDAPATGVNDIRLVRSDGVRVQITADSDISIVGGKIQVVYPRAGHFVNDGPGGAEGSNPYVLPSQSVRISRSGKEVNLGSLSDYSGIWGSYDNVIQRGVMQHIAFHAHGRIKGGDHNAIVGGSYGSIDSGSYGGILFGTNNLLRSTGAGSAIIGGAGNALSGSGPNWILGTSIKLDGLGSVALGFGHVANTGGNGKFIAGRHNIVTAGNGGATLGEENTSSGSYTVTAGFQNVTSATAAVALGRENTANQTASTALGLQAISRAPNSVTIGGGQFAKKGDAQISSTPMKVETSDGTVTTMPSIAMLANTAVAINALVVGKRQDVSGEVAGFLVQGMLLRGTGHAAIVGVPSVTKFDGSPSAWNVELIASPSGFHVRVTGENGKTIRWVAKLDVSEVG